MAQTRTWPVLVALVLLAVALRGQPAEAVEYRLEVISTWENGFTSFLRPGEADDGASGPGLEALMASIDRGEMPRGPLLWDRTVRWAGEAVARAYGATRVKAEITPGGSDGVLWDEVKWEGQPGDRTVWVIDPSGRARAQELYHVVIKAAGPARHYIPYTPTSSLRVVAPRYPLEYLWFHEERGTLWTRSLSRNLDLGQGIGVVGGANSNPTFPDEARVVVTTGDQPTTYKAVLVWREPGANLEAPRGRIMKIR